MKHYRNINEVPKKEYPKTVYKYRVWDQLEPNDNRILTHREIFLSSPTGLMADYKECKLPLRYDLLTEEIIKKFCLLTAKRQNPYRTISQQYVHADRLRNKVLIFNETHRAQIEKEFYERMDRTLGVFCASTSNVNPELWQKASNLMQGYCVGINTYEMLNHANIFGRMGKVDYYLPGHEPIIMPIHFTDEEALIDSTTQVFSIPYAYKGEKEFRFAKYNFDNSLKEQEFSMENRRKSLPESAFEEIILGEQIAEKDKDQIIETLMKTMPNVTLKKAQFIDSKIEVVPL